MRNYVAIVFPDTVKAYEGLHALWLLDADAEITVHGATVLHRGALGQVWVDTKETEPALATAVGVGVGALLGVLAGPLGMAVGAAAGGAIGAATDWSRADTRAQATFEAELVLGIGQSVVIADVSEDWMSAIDASMLRIGGVVHRRAQSAIAADAWFGSGYLYPYEYIPRTETW